MLDFDDPVPVYTVKDANFAEILKNYLNSEGIACRIDGEGQIGLTGIMDVTLLVRAGDADHARRLILDHELHAARRHD